MKKFLLMTGRPSRSNSGSGGPALTAAALTISAFSIIVTARSGSDLSSGLFGANYGIGIGAGYTTSASAAGAVAGAQSYALSRAGAGIAATDVVNVRAFGTLGGTSYGNAIVPVIESASIT